MNRRSLLQYCGASTLFLGSGCFDLSKKSVRICEIFAWTTYETSHEIQLRLSDAEEIVYEETYEIGPQGGFEIKGSDLPEREGRFTIQVKIGGYDWKEWFLPEYAEESISVELRFLESSPTVGLGYSTNC